MFLMNEIRFNQPVQSENNDQNLRAPSLKSKTPSALWGALKTLIKVAVVLGLLYGAIIGSRYLMNLKNGSVSNRYSAVFLTNGQVYFGKIFSNDKDLIVLKQVYYLQSQSGNPQGGDSSIGSQFTLIKMGQEIHGPEDELFINKNQVMFYENLRDDSRIVQSITQTQKK